MKLKSSIIKHYRECLFFGKATPLNISLSFLLNHLIKKGKSKIINIFVKNIEKNRNPLLKYYAAKVYYLTGRDTEVITTLTELAKQFPNHADLSYLLSESLWRKNKKKESRQILEEVLKYSRRLKTWMMLANITENAEDYERLKNLWELYKEEGKIPSNHYSLDGYISTAALRSKNYDEAINLWRAFIIKTINKESIFPRDNILRKFSPSSGATALTDLHRTLNDKGINFFLVSGTLLGCIREGKLLGHDKDIDVGIWNDQCIDKTIQAVIESGLFYVQHSRSNLSVRIKHVNGTAIDLFIHFKDENNYWHGGSKLKWNNTPFTLMEHKFLNGNYLIPENYELYLSENYGDWKIKKEHFDSAFDTPNATILNISEIIVHTYKCLAKSLHNSEKEKTYFYLEKLTAFKEDISFIEKAVSKIF